MKAISDELHAALSNVLGQLPHAQVEQLVVGLRSAVDIPSPLAEQLKSAAQANARQALAAQLAQLGEPPHKLGNGAGDQP